jgi:hypothetical protein
MVLRASVSYKCKAHANSEPQLDSVFSEDTSEFAEAVKSCFCEALQTEKLAQEEKRSGNRQSSPAAHYLKQACQNFGAGQDFPGRLYLHG